MLNKYTQASLRVFISALILIVIITLFFFKSGLDYDHSIKYEHYEEVSQSSDAWYDVYFHPSKSGIYNPLFQLFAVITGLIMWAFKKRK
jgi:hypothetical protein